jgi:RNA polymerase sigma factor (sigma-70 family)
MNLLLHFRHCSMSTDPTCSGSWWPPLGRTTPRTASFIAALRAYPSLEHARNLRSWLLTIAHRKAIDHHRARGRRAVPAGSPEEVAGGKPSSNHRPDTVVASGDPELWTAVSGLPPKQRSAVVLRFATDMSYAGIARSLDCSEDAARRSVHEGLQKLRGEFA